MIYLIILTIYLLSVYINYKWMQKAYYHENGRWKNIEPNNIDLFFVFFPIMNTILATSNLFDSPYRKNYHNTTNKINFFKPKNYDKNP